VWWRIAVWKRSDKPVSVAVFSPAHLTSLTHPTRLEELVNPPLLVGVFFGVLAELVFWNVFPWKSYFAPSSVRSS
jgi:hypothetical protein